MATDTLQNDTTTPNRDGAAAAFMDAWREHQRLDNDRTVDSDGRDSQYAMYAYEGGQDRMMQGFAWGHTDAALAALVAFGRLNLVLDNFFSAADRDPDETVELRRILTALGNLWRFHDRNGADRSTRAYAEYVGAAEKHDQARWNRI